MTIRLPLILALSLGLASCVAPERTTSTTAGDVAARPLKLASWNLEFLAEKDGAGCEPRTAADYRAMRAIADALDADVIAFQEAENEAAAARVFDPARYVVVMERRPGAPSGKCGERNPQQAFIRQAVGFAIRRGIAFDRHPDVSTLMLDNPQLRSGVDITVKPGGAAPIRLLGVHLKSGCFDGTGTGSACLVLLQQVPALERWIDNAALSPVRFAVLGDWNRRLASPGDQIWADLADGEPANAALRLADAGTPPRCDARYTAFIDHIALDKRAGADMTAFAETTYAPGSKHYSDHCPISVTLAR